MTLHHPGRPSPVRIGRLPQSAWYPPVKPELRELNLAEWVSERHPAQTATNGHNQLPWSQGPKSSWC